MTKPRIMLVEDETIIADDLALRLRKMGYEICGTLTSGEDVINSLAVDRPDLILMDIVLQGEMTGIEAAERIGTDFGVPVIFLTAFGDDETFGRAKLADPFGYLLKPFQDRELKIAIEIALFKHQMEKKLRESEEWFRTVFQSSRDAVFILDRDARIVQANMAATMLTGYSRSEMKNISGTDLLEHYSQPDFTAFFDRIQAGTEVMVEAAIRRKDGDLIYTEFNSRNIRIGDQWFMHTAGRDITSRKESEQQLLDYQDKLRDLAAEVALTESRERRRIAGELHDQIGQTLLLTKIKAERVLELNTQQDVSENLNEIIVLLNQLVEDLQRSITDLSPPVLEVLGLEAAIRWLADKIQCQCDVDVHFGGNNRRLMLSEDMTYLLFRAVRELVVNAVNHGRPKRIQIGLLKEDSRIRLEVTDDGRGFDTGALWQPSLAKKGIGLFGIKESLSPLGGKFEIQSAVGQGTLATLILPLGS